MIIKINIHEYKGRGIHLEWENDYKIFANINCDGKYVNIAANRAGLISLARHLLTLSQDGIPNGYDLHLDDGNSLEKGSCELILERIAD